MASWISFDAGLTRLQSILHGYFKEFRALHPHPVGATCMTNELCGFFFFFLFSSFLFLLFVLFYFIFLIFSFRNAHHFRAHSYMYPLEVPGGVVVVVVVGGW
jgi:hypothetical protein